MSLISRELADNERIQEMEKCVYKAPHFSICHVHKTPKNHTCINPESIHYMQAVSQQQNSHHKLVPISRLVSSLALWVRQQWKTTEKQHRQIQTEWKTCLNNVNYCIDILKQLAKQIQDRARAKSLPLFGQLIAQIHGMFTGDSNNISVQSTLKNLQRVIEKYNISLQDDKKIESQMIEQQRKLREKQVQKASNQTKKFSQSALVFSEELARTIQERLKAQKRLQKLKQLTVKKTFNLRQILKNDQNAHKVEQLVIQMQKTGQQEKSIQEILNKCYNLQSLRINNRNGHLNKQWERIAFGMERLKFLKNLSLILRASDLPILTSLFKKHFGAVRQIQNLNLQICDEKSLNVWDVCEFVNSMELRGLHLTLARDNLNKKQAEQLLTYLRFSSSMSYLPLNEIHLNLNKNSIKDYQVQELTKIFNQKACQTKNKSFVA